MGRMASVKHGLPGGDALKWTVMHAIKEIGHPVDSKEITTYILGVKKGARGWYETNARVRNVFDSLLRAGCVELVQRTPIRRVRYVRDIESYICERRSTSKKKVAPGIHTIHGLKIDVDEDGVIRGVLSEHNYLARIIPCPRTGNIYERVNPVGMKYCYVRSRLKRGSGWVVKDEVHGQR